MKTPDAIKLTIMTQNTDGSNRASLEFIDGPEGISASLNGVAMSKPLSVNQQLAFGDAFSLLAILTCQVINQDPAINAELKRLKGEEDNSN